jgi:hypothetical protein
MGLEDHFIRTTEVIERELLASHIAAFPVECCDPERDVADLRNWFAKDGRDFSHVPVRDKQGVILGILERDACLGRTGAAARVMNRDLADLLVDARASLWEAVQRLKGRGVLLVRSPEAGWADGVSGIINHADLEKAPVRVLLFARLTEIEARLRNMVQASGADWEGRSVVAEHVEAARVNRTKWAGELPLLYYLNIERLAKVAGLCSATALKVLRPTDPRSLKEIRNTIAHGNEFEPGHRPKVTVARIQVALELVDRVARGLATVA